MTSVLLAVLLALLTFLVLDHNVVVTVLRSSDSLNVATNPALALWLLLLALRTNLRVILAATDMASKPAGRTICKSWLTSPCPPTGPQ